MRVVPRSKTRETQVRCCDRGQCVVAITVQMQGSKSCKCMAAAKVEVRWGQLTTIELSELGRLYVWNVALLLKSNLCVAACRATSIFVLLGVVWNHCSLLPLPAQGIDRHSPAQVTPASASHSATRPLFGHRARDCCRGGGIVGAATQQRLRLRQRT
jgi:hypothetical protein